jgi:hypothetical protein
VFFTFHFSLFFFIFPTKITSFIVYKQIQNGIKAEKPYSYVELFWRNVWKKKKKKGFFYTGKFLQAENLNTAAAAAVVNVPKPAVNPVIPVIAVILVPITM